MAVSTSAGRVDREWRAWTTLRSPLTLFYGGPAYETIARAVTAVLVLTICSPLHANKYGSVEPIANPAVIDTSPLRDQPLKVREAFATRLLQCGIVSRVVDALTATGAITTINGLNTQFAVGAGGFAGHTNPAYVYTVIDHGPNAASIDDVKVLTDSLGYVLSQGSAFLLDADDPSSFDFPANYVVLNFPPRRRLPRPRRCSRRSARSIPSCSRPTRAATRSSAAPISRSSPFVSDAQFIAGYVQAAEMAGVEYTPIVGGSPSLFQGGAAFPGNDWTVSTRGEEYSNAFRRGSHRALARIRAFHLRVTREVLRKLQHDNDRKPHNDAMSFDCR